MKELARDTIRSDGATLYLVVVFEPDDVWRQDGSGLPGFVEWAIYEVEVESMPDGPLLFWRKGSQSNMDPTDSVDDAVPVASGSTKWDGCSNWTTGESVMAHFDNAEQLDTFGRGLARVYQLALEAVGGGL